LTPISTAASGSCAVARIPRPIRVRATVWSSRTITMIAAMMNMQGQATAGVSTVGFIPQGFPSLTLPDLSLVAQLAPGALGIALMSFTETIESRGAANARDCDHAVLVVDMLRFSRINESMGSLAGDELLITFARRLISALRGGDVLARTGGNEFGILVGLKRGVADALAAIRARLETGA